MKRISHLLLILSLVLGLSRCRYIKNNFVEVASVCQTEKLDFAEEDLFILRIKEVPSVISADGSTSEIPFSIFMQITDSRDTVSEIIEEAYIYLGGFAKRASAGPLFYLVTYPIHRETSGILYNNTQYVSTYSVRKVLVGEWERTNSVLQLEMKADKETIRMEAKLEEEGIKINEISHPKPDIHTIYQPRDLMVDIEDVFNLNGEGGLLFLKNTRKRKLIHPDWNELGRKQCKKELTENHAKVLKTEQITQVSISQCDDEKCACSLSFGIKDKKSGKLRYISYRPS